MKTFFSIRFSACMADSVNDGKPERLTSDLNQPFSGRETAVECGPLFKISHQLCETVFFSKRGLVNIYCECATLQQYCFNLHKEYAGILYNL